MKLLPIHYKGWKIRYLYPTGSKPWEASYRDGSVLVAETEDQLKILIDASNARNPVSP